MLRCYQKALRELEESRDRQKAASEVEQLNLLHGEQVENSEHSVRDGEKVEGKRDKMQTRFHKQEDFSTAKSTSRKHHKPKKKREKEQPEKRKKKELETVHDSTTIIEAAALEWDEQLKYNQYGINRKTRKSKKRHGDEATYTNGDKRCETQAKKQKSDLEIVSDTGKRKKKLKRVHTPEFPEGTDENHKKLSDDLEIVSDSERRKKKKKLKGEHPSGFPEGTDKKRKKHSDLEIVSDTERKRKKLERDHPSEFSKGTIKKHKKHSDLEIVSDKGRRKKEKKVKRDHPSEFSEGTVKNHKKYSDVEIVSVREKKKKKVKRDRLSEFSEGTVNKHRKDEKNNGENCTTSAQITDINKQASAEQCIPERSKHDASPQGESSQSNTHHSTDSPGKVSLRPNHKKRTRDKSKDNLIGNRSLSESVVNGNNHRTGVMENLTVKPNFDKAKLAEAIKNSEIIQENYYLSKAQRIEFSEQGITIRIGQWSTHEIELLRYNMAQFLKCHNLSDPARLLFASRNKDSEERIYWTRFVRRNKLLKELGKGIQRSPLSIYQCARRIYDEKNYVGTYTESEIQKLKRLAEIHGSDWVGIGEVMGRSSMSLNRKYAKLVNDEVEEKKGKWTEEEIQRLNEAVHVVTNTSEEKAVYHDIYWPAVSQMVKSRGTEQCRRKWLHKLCWSMNDNEVQRWTKSDDMTLVESLYESECMEEFDVDWMDIQSAFETKYSPHFLCHKYLNLKKSVPNYQLLNFEEIVDYLYQLFVRAILEAEAQLDSGLLSDQTE